MILELKGSIIFIFFVGEGGVKWAERVSERGVCAEEVVGNEEVNRESNGEMGIVRESSRERGS